jgi:thiamine biosynthesis lipoprotein
MGTYITIKLPEKNQNLFKNLFKIFKDLDNKLSIYKENSEISILNRQKEAILSPISLEIIKKSIQISKETDGFFDITVGKLTKDVYKFGMVNNKLPDEKEIKENTDKISYKNIQIKGKKVILRGDVKLDLGGIGKGFAVDKVAEFLIKKGVEDAVISASGDIRCLNICEMFIQNPFGNDWIVKFRTKLKNTSISTSGNYERFIESKKYNHLINPKTGKSQQNFASITLISIGNNTDIDAYATAVSVMPLDLALKFLNKKNLGFIIILNNGHMIFSKNINNFISLNDYKTINQSKLEK